MAVLQVQLEEIIRAELREPVEEIVRRVVVELVHEQLNGHTEMPLGRPISESPPTTQALTQRLCKDCEQVKDITEFEPHRHVCRRCRREQHHRRQQAAAAADEGLADQTKTVFVSE